jgi:hypothetical protein
METRRAAVRKKEPRRMVSPGLGAMLECRKGSGYSSFGLRTTTPESRSGSRTRRNAPATSGVATLARVDTGTRAVSVGRARPLRGRPAPCAREGLVTKRQSRCRARDNERGSYQSCRRPRPRA